MDVDLPAAAPVPPPASRLRAALLWGRIVAFAGLISAPAIGLLVGGPASSAPAASFENRRLTSFPGWPHSIATLRGFPARFEAYFSDRIAFRDTFIRWNNYARVVVLNDTAAAQQGRHAPHAIAQGAANPEIPVLVGRDGWLFFTGDSNLESCRCSRPFSNRAMEDWAQALEERQRWLAAQGIQYLVYFAPDKHTIYPEQVPAAMRRLSPQSRLEQFLEFMAARQTVRIVDVRPVLLSAKQDMLVYHKTDTHWTSYGAFVAYQQVMRQLQDWFPELAPAPLANYRVTMQPFSGDTAALLGLQDALTESCPVLVERAASTWNGGPIDGWSHLLSHRAVMEGSAGPRAVFLHDSFMDSQRHYFQPHFSAAAWLATRDFYPDFIRQQQPHVVIEEIVERRLQHALKNPPELRLAEPRWAEAPSGVHRQ